MTRRDHVYVFAKVHSVYTLQLQRIISVFDAGIRYVLLYQPIATMAC